MYVKKPRPNKSFYRSLFFGQITKPASTYLCLPGAQAFCVKDGIEAGTIGESTRVIGVERDLPTFKKAIKSLDRTGLDYTLYHDNLHNIEIEGRKKIDLAYIDICGQMTAELLLWLQHLRSHMKEKSVIGFTFTHTARSHDTFYNRVRAGFYGFDEATFSMGLVRRTPNIDSICNSITSMMPGIRFNIADTYHDRGIVMMFLGGYFGRKPGPLKVVSVDKLEGRINNLIRHGARNHQEYGGLKIMWKRCSEHHKRELLKKFGKRKLSRIGLEILS